jgi:Escherichia/Staphylococcus phage prohead protease
MMEYEVRTAEMWPDADYELRAEKDGDGLTLSGYAAVYELPSLPMQFPGVGGGRRFREIIHRGAFADSLAATPDVTLRYQHDLTQLPLARTKGGTMELTDTEHGLHTRAILPDNEWGRPVRDAIIRKDIDGMSFRFVVPKGGERWTRDGNEHIRHLDKIALGPEVSITDMPAYPDTSVAVRNLADTSEADVTELVEIFRVLEDPDGRLTQEQRAVLFAAINARTDEPFADPKLARMRERLRSDAA